MSASRGGIGEEVAVGLVAGSEDFRRVRETWDQPDGREVWQAFERSIKDRASAPASALAFAAAVKQCNTLAAEATTRALSIARAPVTNWVHPEAGCISLSGAHNAHELTLAIDWLWPVLNRDQREAMLGGLIAKSVENLRPTPDGIRDERDEKGQLLFVRRLDPADPHCMHPKEPQLNNWDLWFASGLYRATCLARRAFLAPAPGEPVLTWGRYYDVGYTLDASRVERWKTLARERIEGVLANELGPDGDYAEGLGYAAYASLALLPALIAIERCDGDNLFSPGVLSIPAWMRNQYPADTPRGAANLNDSKIEGRSSLALCLHVAARVPGSQAHAVAVETLERYPGDVSPLALLAQTPDRDAPTLQLPDAAHYRHTGSVVWRTGQGRDDVFFTLKSGAHGGAHQHRDRNTFFLSAYGEHLAVDTGDSRSIPPQRPHFFETEAHNCVLIDGRGQTGDNDNPLTGKILEHAHEGDLSTVLADAGDCYENIAGCRRRVVFARPDLFVFDDRIDGTCTSLQWLLHGYNPDGKATWTHTPGQARLARPNARLDIFLLGPVQSLAVATSGLDAEPKGGLRLEAAIAGDRATAVLVPSRVDGPAPTCERGADGVLCVRMRGQTHRIQQTEGGLSVNGRTFGS